MNDITARLALPMIVPGQAQKETSHNEALALLDAAVQASVVGFGINTPPADPTPGMCWIIGAAPTGSWAGHARQLAAWTAGGWRFVTPTPGFRVWVSNAAVDARFVDNAWRLGVGPAVAIADPAGGSTVDAAARTAITAVLAVLRQNNLVATP